MEYPKTVSFRGKTYYFDMVAPITKDGIYKLTDHTQTVKYALLVNKEA